MKKLLLWQASLSGVGDFLYERDEYNKDDIWKIIAFDVDDFLNAFKKEFIKQYEYLYPNLKFLRCERVSSTEFVMTFSHSIANKSNIPVYMNMKEVFLV